MNELAYRVVPENGLSFVLFVDGVPLAQAIGATGEAIPYWIVKHGIPGWPEWKAEPAPMSGCDVRIVTVCACGEYGCGHTRCRVLYSEDRVTFDQFAGDPAETPSSARFTFERTNYDRVMDEISRLAAERWKENERTR